MDSSSSLFKLDWANGGYMSRPAYREVLICGDLNHGATDCLPALIVAAWYAGACHADGQRLNCDLNPIVILISNTTIPNDYKYFAMMTNQLLSPPNNTYPLCINK